MATPYYNLPLYTETDAPDLTGAYNQAMGLVDAQIKTLSDAVAAGYVVKDTDPTITVDQLANLRVNEKGLVYVKQGGN